MAQELTRISVAMTTYNGERFIADQLESFSRQERLPDELVVSDDGSTDRTLEIVREFSARAPFPVRIFVNAERLGINKNFERAIEMSTGDIIFLSDSDDYWYPQKIRLMAKALEDAPRSGIAVCNADCVDERLQPLGVTAWASIDRFFPSPRLLRKLALGKTVCRRMPSGGCCMAFRARFKPLILPLPESSESRSFSYDHFIAQVIFWSGVGGATLLTEPLLAYRRHTGQASRGPHEPLFRRISQRLASRHGDPYRLAFITRRVESDFAARYCINPVMRRSAMRHLRARLNMPPSFVSRVLIVAREFASLRYHRYSSGWAPAAKDFVFARYREDKTSGFKEAINESIANR